MGRIKVASFFLLPVILFNICTIKPFAQADKEGIQINEINRSETETSLVINSEEIDKIRLPNGNWVSSLNATYTVNRNGTYDFVCRTVDNELLTSSYTVNSLRENLLVTKTPEVRLKLNSEDMLSGMGSMKFKNETNGTWTKYEAYKTSKEWTLDTNEGLKSVYVVFKDNAGNETTDIYDQIYLDLSGPEITKFMINDNDPYTKDKKVKLTINALDNYSKVDRLLISNDNINWTNIEYSKDIQWNLSPSSGKKVVYLKAIDSLGNIGKTCTQSIYLDDVLPYGKIQINNGDSLTNSRNVKLQINFDDVHSGIKRVSIYEKDKSYTFPTVPNSPTQIDWTLSMGATGMVSMEVEDFAGNIYRTDSNTIVIASLEITQFRLTNVVNPKKYNNSNTFKPLKWDFPPEEMLSGANIEFDINYKLDLDNETKSFVESRYIIEIIGDNGYYKKIEMPYDSSIYNGFKSTVTMPSDVPNNAKVYISSTLTATITSNGKSFTNKAYFPAKDERALIGIIKGNIKETIRFNEIS